MNDLWRDWNLSFEKWTMLNVINFRRCLEHESWTDCLFTFLPLHLWYMCYNITYLSKPFKKVYMKWNTQSLKYFTWSIKILFTILATEATFRISWKICVKLEPIWSVSIRRRENKFFKSPFFKDNDFDEDL